jgi:hypothetical protein
MGFRQLTSLQNQDSKSEQHAQSSRWEMGDGRWETGSFAFRGIQNELKWWWSRSQRRGTTELKSGEDRV